MASCVLILKRNGVAFDTATIELLNAHVQMLFRRGLERCKLAESKPGCRQLVYALKYAEHPKKYGAMQVNNDRPVVRS